MVPREENRTVVELFEYGSKGDRVSKGKFEHDDLIDADLPSNMKMVSRFNGGVLPKYENFQDLYIKGVQYFKWAVENPIQKTELIKGGAMAGSPGTIDVPRPWTIAGLRTWLGMGSKIYEKFRSGEGYEQFHPVIEFFEDCIRTQKFEHAVVGIYNAGLVSRDLGLADKTEVKEEINIKAQIIGMKIIAD